MTRKPAFGLLILLASWVCANDAFAGTAVVIQPVSATGAHTIIGSDIFLPAGPQRVRLEIRVAGWGDEDLKTVQVKIDSLGYDNGHALIAPSVVPCPSNNAAGHNFCAQTLESGSRCSGCPSGGTDDCLCTWGFQNTFRPDYVGFGYGHFSAVDISTNDARFGLAVGPDENMADPGTSLYLGTFFLDIPAAAQGMYIVGIITAETFFQDQGAPPNNNVPIELHTVARIIIGDPVAPGCRYVAFEPEEPGEQTAVRVTLTSLYHPGPPVAAGEDRDFSAIEDEVRWLGPPANFPDTLPGRFFLAAALQCTPHFADWGSMGTVQIYGDAVVPSSVYTIHQVDIACQNKPNNPFCFGLPQVIHTGQWGDAGAPFARSDQAAQPDAADLAELLDAFRVLAGAPPKSLTHLRGAAPDPATATNFLDVQLAVDAVRGRPYPYPVPSPCPP